MLGAAVTALYAMDAVDPAPTAFLKYVYTPFDQETARLEGAKKFVANSRESIVFTNESDAPWRFGLVPEPAGHAAGQGPGTLQIRRLKGEEALLEPLATLTGEDHPVVINPRFSTIVVTPVQPGASDFHRTCYLQDSSGKRIVFSLNKGARGGAMPRLGFEEPESKSLAKLVLRLSPNGDNLFLIAKEKCQF
jgi:hypothetical protein